MNTHTNTTGKKERKRRKPLLPLFTYIITIIRLLIGISAPGDLQEEGLLDKKRMVLLGRIVLVRTRFCVVILVAYGELVFMVNVNFMRRLAYEKIPHSNSSERTKEETYKLQMQTDDIIRF